MDVPGDQGGPADEAGPEEDFDLCDATRPMGTRRPGIAFAVWAAQYQDWVGQNDDRKVLDMYWKSPCSPRWKDGSICESHKLCALGQWLQAQDMWKYLARMKYGTSVLSMEQTKSLVEDQVKESLAYYSSHKYFPWDDVTKYKSWDPYARMKFVPVNEE